MALDNKCRMKSSPFGLLVFAASAVGVAVMFSYIKKSFNDFLVCVPIVHHTLTLDRLSIPPGDRRHLRLNTFFHVSQPMRPGKSPFPTPSYDLLYSNALLELDQPLEVTVPAHSTSRYWSMQVIDPFGQSALSISSRTISRYQPRESASSPSQSGNILNLLFYHQSEGDVLSDNNNTAVIYHPFVMPYRYYYVIIRVQAVVQNETDVKLAAQIQSLFSVQYYDAVSSEAKSALRGTYIPKPANPPRSIANLSLEEIFTIATDIMNVNQPHFTSATTSSFPQVSLPRPPLSPLQTLGASLARWLVIHILQIKLRGYTSITSAKRYLSTSFVDAMISWKFIYPSDMGEARYYATYFDANGQRLQGFSAGNNENSNIYVLHMPAPPTEAFWSVSVYDAATAQLIPNSVNVYSVGNDLSPGQSLSVFLSPSPPSEIMTSDKRNVSTSLLLYTPFHDHLPSSSLLSGEDVDAHYWLPTPRASFYLVVRLYAPTFTDDSYSPALPMLLD